MTVLVIGATGNVGARVTARLVARRLMPRLLVRDLGKANAKFGDGVETALGDLTDRTSLARACRGVEAVFLVSSGPDIPQIDAVVSEVANEANVRRLVKLSAQGARAAGEDTAVALWHARGEKAIRASGVPFTFVRAVGFMTNALAWAPSIRAAGVVRASTGDGRIAMVHPEDIAAVAVEALLSPRFEGEAFPVTGPALLSYAEMTAQIGEAIGKPLRFEAISDPQAREALLGHGLPPPMADALVGLWREVREGKVALVSGDVARVTGRQPTPFAQFARDHARAFAGG